MSHPAQYNPDWRAHLRGWLLAVAILGASVPFIAAWADAVAPSAAVRVGQDFQQATEKYQISRAFPVHYGRDY
jgi:hypothetical protein